MSIEKKLKEFFIGPILDDFEKAIFDFAIEHLPEHLSEIIKSQVALFNRSHRYFINEGTESEKYICQFYWYEWFKNRLDYPKLFKESDEEKCLCSMVAVLPTEPRISIKINYVLGIACFIELKSDDETYRPLSPTFVIKDFECYLD